MYTNPYLGSHPCGAAAFLDLVWKEFHDFVLSRSPHAIAVSLAPQACLLTVQLLSGIMCELVCLCL